MENTENLISTEIIHVNHQNNTVNNNIIIFPHLHVS